MNILIIIFGILLFNLIVFVHEFGHFFRAKKFGVKVNEFAIGMGPKIAKWQKVSSLNQIMNADKSVREFIKSLV